MFYRYNKENPDIMTATYKRSATLVSVMQFITEQLYVNVILCIHQWFI